jgi:hypothetical protein
MDIKKLCEKSNNNNYVLVWFLGMDIHLQAGLEFDSIEPVYSSRFDLIGYNTVSGHTNQFYDKDQIISFAIMDMGEE